MKNTVCFYDAKRDAVFIHSDAMSPDYSKMNWKETFREHYRVHAMSYQDRIDRYATPEQRKEIKQMIKAHAGAALSEYS